MSRSRQHQRRRNIRTIRRATISKSRVSQVLSTHNTFRRQLRRVTRRTHYNHRRHRARPHPCVNVRCPHNNVTRHRNTNRPTRRSLPQLFKQGALRRTIPSSKRSRRVNRSIINPSSRSMRGRRPQDPRLTSSSQGVARRQGKRYCMTSTRRHHTSSKDQVLLFTMGFTSRRHKCRRRRGHRSTNGDLANTTRGFSIIQRRHRVGHRGRSTYHRSRSFLQNVTLLFNRPMGFRRTNSGRHRRRYTRAPLQPSCNPRRRRYRSYTTRYARRRILRFFARRVCRQIEFINCLDSSFSTFTTPRTTIFIPSTLPTSPSYIIPIPTIKTSNNTTTIPSTTSSSTAAAPFFKSSSSHNAYTTKPDVHSVSST